MSKVQKKKPKQKARKQAPRPALARLVEGVGSSLGSLVGMKDLGRDAGSWLARVTGLGKYTLHQNSFTKSSDSVPQFEFAPDGSVIVTHREFVRDITGSPTFEYKTFDICPTESAAFPWLSVMAQAYEQYEFLGLLACYVPTSGDAIASTNNALGTVMIATEYDVSRKPFHTKSEMEQYMFVTSEKPSKSQIHPVECNPNRDVLNARYMDGPFRTQAAAIDSTAASAGSNDIARNLRCTGRLQIATTGQQAVTTVGELWWTYKVKLSKPRGLPPGAEGGNLHATQGATPIVSGEAQFAGAIVVDDSTSPARGIGVTSDTITLYGERPGTLIDIVLMADGVTGSGTYTFGSTTLTSCTAVAAYFNNGIDNSGAVSYMRIDQSTVAGTTQCVYIATYQVSTESYVTPAKIVFSAPTITSTLAAQWNLRVQRRPAVGANIYHALTMSREEEMLLVVKRLMATHNDEQEEKYVVTTPVTPKRSAMSRVLGL
jgi:hypothetical protein